MREDRKSARQLEPGRGGADDLPDGRIGDLLGAGSDSELVKRAVSGTKEGNREALHFLYVRYAPDVLDCVAHLVGDQSEAEDITQGLFCELVRTIAVYEEREGPFGAWILRVARNAALRPGHREAGRGES